MDSAIFKAIKKGDQALVTTLLDSEPGLVSARDEKGVSVLLTAAYYQQPKIAALLIERGAPVDIFEACAAGSLENLNANLKKDPGLLNAFASDGFQPLGLAAFFGHTEIVRALLDNGAIVDMPSKNDMGVTPLNSAAAGGHLEITCMLLEHSANPNTPQADDFVPLHAAAQNGQRKMIELLLAFGANRTFRNKQGKSAWDIAAESGHPDLIDLLG